LPAAATSSARLAWGCPFTSAKSTSSRARSANSFATSIAALASSALPSRKSAISERQLAPRTRRPSTTPAPRRFPRGRSSHSILPPPPARRASDGLDRPFQAEPAKHGNLSEPLALYLLGRRQNPQCNRQVEGGAFFSYVGRGQIDRDSAQREREPGVREGGGNTVTPFFHRPLRQTDRDEGRETVGDVGLYLHEVSVNSQGSGRADAGKHGPGYV